jgi:hypothetical protein
MPFPFAMRSNDGGDGGGVSVRSMTMGLEAVEVSTRLMKTAGSPRISSEHLKQASLSGSLVLWAQCKEI